MKRFRKCDTKVYRRRRIRERDAHAERVKRQRLADIEQARIRKANQERYLATKREYEKQEQALVDVLARRLYQLSPEHAAQARTRETFRMLKAVVRLFPW